MSSIQDQIKSLQRKQATIEFYESMRSTMAAQGDPVGHEGVASEVCERLNHAIDAEISLLLGDAPLDTRKVPELPQVSEADMQRFLLLMRTLSVNPPVAQISPPPPAETSQPVKRAPTIDPNDPLRFLLNHKHFDGKTVIVATPNGKVRGVVRGLDAPHIVVKTETGYTVNVSPENCEIEN